MQRLTKLLGRKGSIVVYNQTFEETRLLECGKFIPEFRGWVDDTRKPMVDLLVPFRGFTLYHPDQHGSASLKAVLPALTGKSYEDLEIHEGGQASEEFMRVTFGKATDAERRKVCQNLEEYCGQDALGMLDIIARLKTFVRIC